MKLSAEFIIKDFLNKQFTFNTIEAFQTFIEKEAKFWNEALSLAGQNPSANQFIQKHNSFQQVLNEINAWKPQFETWDESTLISILTSSYLNHLKESWLWSGYPFIQKWVELNNTDPEYADGFFEAAVLKSTKHQNNYNYFNGYLIAYEFIHQDKTSINKRRNSERKSLTNLRDELLEKHNQLIGNVDEFEISLNNWKLTTQTDFSEWHTTQKTLLDETILAQSKSFQERLAAWTQTHTDTNNKFREELRFESAASYWGEKVNSFRKQGYWWGAGLLTSLILGICLFTKYFLAWLEGQPSGLGLGSIEGVVIFATILSSFAFLVKSLSKMTFSSFHLMRDAEERQQLTHLYLSLRDGRDEDNESRNIILQALFSRSDTGLLAGDHSPTMPTLQDAIRITRP
jgi:hypothetical protein